MKVTLVGRYPRSPGHIIGGVQAVMSVLAAALSQHPTVEEVNVITFHPDGRNEWRTVDDRLRVCYLRSQTHFMMATGAVWNTLRGRRVIRQLSPDLVHGQGLGLTPTIATRAGYPSVITVHGLPHVEASLASQGLLDRWRVQKLEAMVRRTLQRAQAVISTSEYDAQALQGLVHGLRVSIPNPVDPEFFKASSCDGSASQRLLFAGVFLPRKNIVGLLLAFVQVRKKLPHATLTLVGPPMDPGYAATIPEHIRSLGLEHAVNLLGHVDNACLIDELRQCSALALFSNEETSPTIIAQALVMGKPVVASRVGGVPEMVTDGENGFLVAPGDVNGLAVRLTEVLGNPVLNRQMGERSGEIGRQRFEPAAVAQRTVEVYEKVLAENSRG